MPDAKQWAKIKKDPVRYAKYLKMMREYTKNRRIIDPEFRRKRSEKVVRYQRKKYMSDPEYRKKRSEYSKKWRDKNPEKVKKYYPVNMKSRICKVLMNHGQDLRDDPEHLQTDFMIMLINREDKR